MKLTQTINHEDWVEHRFIAGDAAKAVLMEIAYPFAQAFDAGLSVPVAGGFVHRRRPADVQRLEQPPVKHDPE